MQFQLSYFRRSDRHGLPSPATGCLQTDAPLSKPPNTPCSLVTYIFSAIPQARGCPDPVLPCQDIQPVFHDPVPPRRPAAHGRLRFAEAGGTGTQGLEVLDGVKACLLPN